MDFNTTIVLLALIATQTPASKIQLLIELVKAVGEILR